jgi:hypothetical protein
VGGTVAGALGVAVATGAGVAFQGKLHPVATSKNAIPMNNKLRKILVLEKAIVMIIH